MSALLRRREMMVRKAGANWDYEWKPSQGLLTANGWTIVGSPTGSEVMDSSGVVLTGAIELKAPVGAMSIGVMEIDFVSPTQASGATIYASISNGTNGAKFTIDRQYWRKCNKAINSAWNMDVLITKSPGNTQHTVRLEMGSSASDYYVDGTLCADDYSNASIVNCTYNMVGYYLSGKSATITGIRYMIDRMQ